MSTHEENRPSISRKEFYWYVIGCCGVITLASLAMIISVLHSPIRPQNHRADGYAAREKTSSAQSVPSKADTSPTAYASRQGNMEPAVTVPVTQAVNQESDPTPTTDTLVLSEALPFYCEDTSYQRSSVYPLKEWYGCEVYQGNVRKEKDAIDYYLSQDAYFCIYDNGTTALYANEYGYYWGTYQSDGLVHLHTLLQDIPYTNIGEHSSNQSDAVVSVNENGFWYTGYFQGGETGTMYYDFNSDTAYFVGGSGLISSPNERFLFISSRTCLIDRDTLTVHVLITNTFHDVPYLDAQGRMILLQNNEKKKDYEDYACEAANVYQYYSYANAACFNVKPEYCKDVVYLDPEEYIRKEELYYVLYRQEGVVQKYSRLKIEDKASFVNASHQIGPYWLCGSKSFWYSAIHVPLQKTVDEIHLGFVGDDSVEDMRHNGFSGRFLYLNGNSCQYSNDDGDNFTDILTNKGILLADTLINDHNDLLGFSHNYKFYSNNSIVINAAHHIFQQKTAQFSYLVYDLDSGKLHTCSMVTTGSAYLEEDQLGSIIRDTERLETAQSDSVETAVAPTDIPLFTPVPATQEVNPVVQPSAAATDIPLLTPEPTAAATEIPLLTPEPIIDGTETVAAAPEDGSIPISASIASTYLNNSNGPTKYTSDQLTDKNEETSWQFRTGDIKRLSDAYVEFTFRQAAAVQTLWIKNGFWKITKGYDQYPRNSRPKKIEISFLYQGQNDYTDAVEITLKDDKKREDWQKVDLGTHENVQAVRIRILSIFKGSKFPKDVAISEVEFH